MTPDLQKLIEQNREAYLTWFDSLKKSPTVSQCSEFFKNLDPDIEVDWDEAHPIIVANWFDETF
jgi:hypothetical protein